MLLHAPDLTTWTWHHSQSFAKIETARADSEKALAAAKEELGEAMTSRDELEEEIGALHEDVLKLHSTDQLHQTIRMHAQLQVSRHAEGNI